MSAIATLPAAPLALIASSPPADWGPRPMKWTREQYYELGKLGFFQDRRVELIFGEIVEMSPIGWLHVVGCRKTAELMERVFAGIGWVSRADPVNLGDSDPQPDIAVIPGEFDEHATHPTTALLIVEVSDATLDGDLTIKAELYATANFADYWVLDLVNRQLHVLRDPVALPAGLGATAYRTHATFNATDTVSPLAAPHVAISVADLLPALQTHGGA